jgi:hypothetical protein
MKTIAIIMAISMLLISCKKEEISVNQQIIQDSVIIANGYYYYIDSVPITGGYNHYVYEYQVNWPYLIRKCYHNELSISTVKDTIKKGIQLYNSDIYEFSFWSKKLYMRKDYNFFVETTSITKNQVQNWTIFIKDKWIFTKTNKMF